MKRKGDKSTKYGKAGGELIARKAGRTMVDRVCTRISSLAERIHMASEM